MSLVSIFFIAMGLAIDAFVVSIASGTTIKRLKIRHALLIAGFFGFFQAIMPVAGWLVGAEVRNYIESYGYWIVFAVLSAIGLKMIYEAFSAENADEIIKNPLHIPVLLALSVATSIDALAVGFSLSVLIDSIFIPIIFIGLITFLMSFIGVYIGNYGGNLFGKKFKIVGGLILIAIGVSFLNNV